MDDYYKTVGYACLYIGLGEKVGQISAEEVTKRIDEERQKQENILLKALKNLMTDMKMSAEQTLSVLSIPTEEWVKYKAML